MDFNLNEFLATEFSNWSLSYTDVLILEYHCKNKELVVELGTCMGNTAKMLSQLAKKVITIDVFEKIEEIKDTQQKLMYFKQFVGRPHYFDDIKLKLYKFNPSIQVIQGNTSELTEFCSDLSIDTLFIDADHSYDGVKSDFENWFTKVKVGGIILLHDCVMPLPQNETEVYFYYEKELKNNSKIKEVEWNGQIEHYGTSMKILQKISI